MDAYNVKKIKRKLRPMDGLVQLRGIARGSLEIDRA